MLIILKKEADVSPLLWRYWLDDKVAI